MEKQETVVLATTGLSIGYGSNKEESPVCAGINTVLRKGELVCLLGPNGSGKSTLIRTLAGIQRPLAGSISLCEKQLAGLTPPQIARQLSLVLTEKIEADILSVYELVSLGRMPHTNWMGKITAVDQEHITQAIQISGVQNYLNRKVTTLSDGEKQKVMIARALAQDTPLIILDEPTAHLDLPSRVEIMRLLRTLTRQTGKSVIVSTHELELALQAADKIWLMDQQGTFKTGVPEDLIINGDFAQAFKKNKIEFDAESGTFKIHDTFIHTVTLIGNNFIANWTKKALQREGINATADPSNKIKIEITEAGGAYCWETTIGEVNKSNKSVEELINTLKLAIGEI